MLYTGHQPLFLSSTPSYLEFGAFRARSAPQSLFLTFLAILSGPPIAPPRPERAVRDLAAPDFGGIATAALEALLPDGLDLDNGL